jgi:hypothetical protein
MTGSIPRLLGAATVGAGVAAAGYVGLVTGACPLDLGVGRRVRPLGPQVVEMAAPREMVFDVIAEPYLGRPPKALAAKLGCWIGAATWCWRPISPHWVGGWAWSPRRWRRSGSPGPNGSSSGWSAGRFPTSWTPSCSTSTPVGPARGWSTTGRSGPTCGGRDSTGVRWLRGAGRRPSRPRWLRSRPKLNGVRRAPQELAAPARSNRPQPQPDNLPSPLARSTQPGRATPRPAIRYAGCSMRAPAARIAASARWPSPGCRSTARTSSPRTTVSNPSRTASGAVSFTQ